jgi:ribosomal protein S18 acetylase RimI-like enzyme
VTPFVTDLSQVALVRAIDEHRREAALDWAGVAGAVVEERPGFLRVVSGYGVFWANSVVGGALSEGEADRAIEESVSAFRSAGVPGLWTVTPLSAPEDLAERLVAHGFVPDEPLPWMAADLGEVSRSGPPAGLRIERVTNRRLHADWLTAMDRGFGMTAETVRMLDEIGGAAPVSDAGPWVRFVGDIEGQPVASSGLLLHSGVAGLFNVATLPAFRRRGYGTAMTNAALEHARGLGYRVAVLGTSELGRGIYERMGFRDVCVTHGFIWEPGPDG